MDEDDYREMATSMREFADQVDDGATQAHRALADLVGGAGGSMAMAALEEHWGKVNGKHLKNLAEAGRVSATAMDGVATLIEGAKLAAIVQLGILAAEIIATAASAPFTLGLSTLGGLAATQVTRIAVKRIFKEVCEEIARHVVDVAMGPVYEALGSMAGDLIVQLGTNAMTGKEGIDLGRTARAGKDGLKSGAAQMELLSAGSGSGSGGASGGFSFQPGDYDRAVAGLERGGATLGDGGRGRIDRARAHQRRTRRGDPIANAANVALDRVTDGIRDATGTAAKHLRKQMTDGLRQMKRNHLDNDAGLARHFDGINKGKKPATRGPQPGATPSVNMELEKLNRSTRPKLRKKTQFAVFRDAKRASNGEDFICPNSGKTIKCERDAAGNAIKYNERGRRVTDGSGFTRPAPNPPSSSGKPQNFHFGHVSDSEYRRLKNIVEDHPGQFKWKEVLNEYNDPKHYQVEDPSTNVGHGSESTAPGYGHYGKNMLNDPNFGSPGGNSNSPNGSGHTSSGRSVRHHRTNPFG
ncbi:HNH/ENDO VII family nuclease [Streptomyces sp. NRRL F-5755]|uniref:HNH/ENDO VII family nuclease n=1 Tax=Streptomyces sp. NRRL F-5755 TaxID=1519475 RepID=UPI001F3A15CD|nr:HNH/ENDO VII family nuclease [Streptomyces sp. NRRL F-5755]